MQIVTLCKKRYYEKTMFYFSFYLMFFIFFIKLKGKPNLLITYKMLYVILIVRDKAKQQSSFLSPRNQVNDLIYLY